MQYIYITSSTSRYNPLSRLVVAIIVGIIVIVIIFILIFIFFFIFLVYFVLVGFVENLKWKIQPLLLLLLPIQEASMYLLFGIFHNQHASEIKQVGKKS